MAVSKEVRRLSRAWQNRAAWPKRLEWIEVKGLRGWKGQRVEFPFPMVAIVGENGSGKSTMIQAAASVYREKSVRSGKYASEFFPSTAWDKIAEASIKFGYIEAAEHLEGSIRRPQERWKGNDKRPIRPVRYFDLSRIQPLSARVGYAKIAKTRHVETSAEEFKQDRVERLSEILGRKYVSAKMALSNIDDNRLIPVLGKANSSYSGYHQGQGETTIAELLHPDLPKYSLLLIDEIESSLHPRAQRRLIRDLANICRNGEIQIILTTHSPYILEELPDEARIQILERGGERHTMNGVSPQFSMTNMDEIPHPDIEIYAEDDVSVTLIREILSQKNKDLASRSMIIPCGPSSVGYQLGLMVSQKRFPRPTAVFLDGDCADADGCFVLPGGDAPERVVFEELAAKKWSNLWLRLGRRDSDVKHACETCTSLHDHHEWLLDAGRKLSVPPHILWHAMCAEWVEKFIDDSDVTKLTAYLEDRIAEYS